MPYPTQAGSTETGFADEQARKRQQYEDALDRFAGFEPGESQLSDEQIMARRAARQQLGVPVGFSRQQPFAQFAQRGVNDIPFDTLLAHLKAQPGMVEHLEGIDLDGDGVPDIPFQPSPQMMADPMGRMQWQAMLQNRQRMMQAAQQRRTQRKEINNQVLLATLQANDPLFQQTYTRLISYVRRLPDKVQRPFLEAVDRTPGAFLDLYSQLREGIMRELGSTSRVPQSMPQPASDDPRARIRQAVAGRMSAPALENAGIMDDRMPGATRAAERAALIKRVKSGGAREGDLLKYLELSGL